MNAIKWISAEAKKIKRAHPKKYKAWTQYIKEASVRYARLPKAKTRRLGVSTVPAGLPLYSPRKEVMAGVKTTSRTHTDRNRITANIQVGSTQNTMVLQKLTRLNSELTTINTTLAYIAGKLQNREVDKISKNIYRRKRKEWLALRATVKKELSMTKKHLK